MYKHKVTDDNAHVTLYSIYRTMIAVIYAFHKRIAFTVKELPLKLLECDDVLSFANVFPQESKCIQTKFY